ncbi:MAG: hypothetical protein KME06_15620 [Kastovskya adunca ATA6-11-RM4]|nr:hypothetical protein [Kastovskya adunca ATA6-11-RM4]
MINRLQTPAFLKLQVICEHRRLFMVAHLSRCLYISPTLADELKRYLK